MALSGRQEHVRGRRGVHSPRAVRSAEDGLVRGMEVALFDDRGLPFEHALLLTREPDEVAAPVAPVDTEFLDALDLGGAVAALVEVGDGVPLVYIVVPPGPTGAAGSADDLLPGNDPAASSGGDSEKDRDGEQRDMHVVGCGVVDLECMIMEMVTRKWSSS